MAKKVLYAFFLFKRRVDLLIRKLKNFIKYGTFDMFVHVYIENITSCNRRCGYCPNSKSDRGLVENARKMETGLFRKIIDELAELGLEGEIAPCFYGEPLLDSRLPDLIEYTRNKLRSSYIMLFTNGDFLSVGLYKRLISSGVDVFIITRHGGSAPPFINEILKYRKEHGKDGVKLKYEKLKFIFNRGGVELGKAFRHKNCEEAALIKIGIQWDGNVVFCCNDYYASVKLGSLMNERLIDIWRKPYYRQIRGEIKRGISELEICKICKMGTPLPSMQE